MSMLLVIGAAASIITAGLAIVIFCLVWAANYEATCACENGHKSYGSRIFFCPDCGKRARKVPARRCRRGHKSRSGDVFCRKCGEKI